MFVTRQDSSLVTLGDIPQSDAVIVTRRSQNTAIGRKGNTHHFRPVPEHMQFPTAIDVPDLDLAVASSRRHYASVGRKLDHIGSLSMPDEVAQMLAGTRVDERDRTNFAGHRELVAIL